VTRQERLQEACRHFNNRRRHLPSRTDAAVRATTLSSGVSLAAFAADKNPAAVALGKPGVAKGVAVRLLLKTAPMAEVRPSQALSSL
jgi:hypothetical protein